LDFPVGFTCWETAFASSCNSLKVFRNGISDSFLHFTWLEILEVLGESATRRLANPLELRTWLSTKGSGRALSGSIIWRPQLAYFGRCSVWEPNIWTYFLSVGIFIEAAHSPTIRNILAPASRWGRWSSLTNAT
jgi:hypothetical protein